MRPRPAGIVLGVAGMAAFGWGLFHLMKLGSCGNPGDPPCPADAWPYFVAVPVGLGVAIVSTFVGGGVIAFGGIFQTVGVVSLMVAADGGVNGDTTFPLVFGLAFCGFGALPLLLALLGRRKVKRAERLVATGRTAVATILDVVDTGVTINDNPRVTMRLRVEPTGVGGPFEANKTVTVPRVAIPRAGDRYPAWYDPTDPDGIMLGTDVEADAPSHIRALFARAGRVPDDDAAAPAPHAATPDAAGADAAGADVPVDRPISADWVSQLAQLNDLRLKGALSDSEFEAAKGRLLDDQA